jgi:uncharacterized membrane protein
MLNKFLALLPDLGTLLLVLLAVVGVIVAIFPLRRFKKICAVCIIAIGIASVYYTQKAQSDMQVEMFNRLIGGDDYCYLFVINPRGLSAAPVSILHPGHHPLHDVSVIIIAVPGPDATPEEQLRAVLAPFQNLFFPILYPRMSPLNFTLPVGSYRVDIDAANGGVVEMIEVKDIDGKAEPSFRVSRKSNGEQLVPAP